MKPYMGATNIPTHSRKPQSAELAAIIANHIVQLWRCSGRKRENGIGVGDKHEV